MKKIITLIFLVCFVAVGITGFYFYKKSSDLKKDPQVAVLQETESLVNKVGRLILLPQGELPVVATVSEPEKLKDQAFFRKAKVGDKVLLYQNAKKIYLYDPVANKVLEVGPINIGTNN